MRIEISEEIPGKASTAQIVNVVKGARKLQALVKARSPELSRMLSVMEAHFKMVGDVYGPTFSLSLAGEDGAALASYHIDWRFTKQKQPLISPEAVIELFTGGMYPVWKMLEDAVRREEAKLDELSVVVARRKIALGQMK
jgi:hypothetical protein